jgi:integrase/recombinase XerD
MATVNPILNKRYKSKDDTYPIIIRLINGRDIKLHPTGYKVREKYWHDGEVTKAHPDSDIINSVIDELIRKAKRYFADCQIREIPINLRQVFMSTRSGSFTAYLKHRSKQHKQAGQIEMRLKVDRYLKEFTLCFGKEIYFGEVDQDFLRTYEAWLIKQGNAANTRAKKFEFLGKYYANAIREGKAPEPNPFKAYKIKTTPVKKDKLSLSDIKAMEDLQLLEGPLRLARDLFLFSYYCKGARFETCITMKKAQVIKGRLHFQSNKGMKFMSVALHSKLKAIIDHYKKIDSEYIFGRINIPKEELTGMTKRSKLGSENYMLNRSLKTVAEMVGIKIPLSFHHARHSLAFHLKQSSGNIGAIQDILGHSRSQITEVYLKSLDDEYLDKELVAIYGS